MSCAYFFVTVCRWGALFPTSFSKRNRADRLVLFFFSFIFINVFIYYRKSNRCFFLSLLILAVLVSSTTCSCVKYVSQ